MNFATKTAKEMVLDMLRHLPDDVAIEDIEYHVSVMAGFERGARDDEAGRFVSQEEAGQRLPGPRTE